jgi:hypothetical protein
MSFDEQPDGDIHGECAAEIHRLEQELKAERDRSFVLGLKLMGKSLEKVQLTNQLDACRPYLKDGETVARLERSESFYRRRCEALQAWQSSMRDPERVIVCDILANGFTLDQPFAGDRYAWLVPAAPTTKETGR